LQIDGNTVEEIAIPNVVQTYQYTPEELEAMALSDSEDDGVDDEAEEVGTSDLEAEEILNRVEDEDLAAFYDLGILEGVGNVTSLTHWCVLNLCRSDLEDDYLSDYEDESEDSSSMDGFIVPDDVDVGEDEDSSGDSEFPDDVDTLPLRSRLRPTRLRQRGQRSTCSISVLDSDEEDGNEKEREEDEKGRPPYPWKRSIVLIVFTFSRGTYE